jgi:FO synthase
LTPDEVLAAAKAGEAAGCKEALFTLGDKPERRYRAARRELADLGHETTLSYLAEVARLVLTETSLLPHLNPGTMTAAEIIALRQVSVSQGLMLESASARLCQKGGPHHGSPDKRPEARLETIRLAGEHGVPFTSGILIGIGETRRERIEALLALRELNDRYGHIQEIIIQNFRAKPGTRMADAAEPSLDELLWTIATARILFGPAMTIQAPPNLSPGVLARLLEAGINDWGGVSPVTPDFVNPEMPWPHLEALARETGRSGKLLTERLAIYPVFVAHGERWLDPALRKPVLDASDSDGLARTDGWTAGTSAAPPAGAIPMGAAAPALRPEGRLGRILDRACSGRALGEQEIVTLFRARGEAFAAVCAAADELRAEVDGDAVSYVVTRNINYTNVCYFRCQFCAFSKGKMNENLRGRPYDLDTGEIARRTREAWARGASEICMQGGIHPDYTGQTYLNICRAVKDAAPDIHIHAFSPLEVWQGAHTLGHAVPDFLAALRDAGLGSLPGTAAEILDDEIRAVLCGKGRARKGPTFREAVLMHAVARLALHPNITNIQTSWVKMGPDGAKACLAAGANDLGGTLMNETITRAAGASHGQEMPPERMEALIGSLGRTPIQRTTLYRPAPQSRATASFGAPALSPAVNPAPKRPERDQPARQLIRPGLSASDNANAIGSGSAE